MGPGYGALTDHLLASSPQRLDLVELDRDMIAILKDRYQDNPILTLHECDILTFTPTHFPYIIIANIPYYITSPILFYFLYTLPESPQSMVIMMQKEVGEKILAYQKKKPQSSYLSLAMQQACEHIEMVRLVGKESFNPIPKVDSIVLRFISRKSRDQVIEQQMLTLWNQAFTHPRKTLISNLLSHGYARGPIEMILSRVGYDSRVRAESIALQDWYTILPLIHTP